MKTAYKLMGCIAAVSFLFTGCSILGAGFAKELARGTYEEDIYHNEFAGLKFILPDKEWAFASDEEIAAMMGVSVESYQEGGNLFAAKLLELQNIYDMVARDTITGRSVIVIFENLRLVRGGPDITAEEYLASVMENLRELPGVSYVFKDVSAYDVGGSEYYLLETSVSDVGLAQYYFCRKVDDFMLSIIVTLYADEELDAVMYYFS